MYMYIGIPLFTRLLDAGTRAAGTLRLNRRGVPNDVKDAKLRQGQVIYRRLGEMLCLKWSDKRDISFLSTAHSADMVPGRRRHGESTSKLKYCFLFT